jgi:hypothetical protein
MIGLCLKWLQEHSTAQRCAGTFLRSIHWPWFAVAAAVVAGCARLLWIVRRYGVNVFFWDQWDYLDPLFRGESLWTHFRWQHGPIRQGLGYFVIDAIYAFSGWDARSDGFAGIVAMACAAALLLAVSKRLFDRLSVFDAIVPLAVLSSSAFEVLVGTPNPSHGPLPLLLVAAFSLSLFIERAWIRTAVTSALTFAAVYTGFGLFLGLVAPVVFAANAIRQPQARLPNLTGLALGFLSWASFLQGYRFMPATDCFRFPDPQPVRYLTFFGALAIRPFALFAHSGAGAAAAALGGCALVLVSAIAGFHFLRRGDPLSRTVFVLCGFSLLFAAGSAVGRACLGTSQAEASRYVPYMAPAVVGAYFLLRSLPATRLRDVALSCLLLGCIAKETWPGLHVQLQWYGHGKSAWAECFRARGDIARCDAETGFPIYPRPEATHLDQKLAWLRERRLGLFKQPVSTTP